MKTKTKTFDAIEWKRRAATRIHSDLESMTLDQKIDYWRRKGEELNRVADRLRDSKAKG